MIPTIRAVIIGLSAHAWPQHGSMGFISSFRVSGRVTDRVKQQDVSVDFLILVCGMLHI